MTFLEHLVQDDTKHHRYPENRFLSPDLVQFLLAASDAELTVWMRGLLMDLDMDKGDECRDQGPLLELFGISNRFNISPPWLRKAIEARIKDRWMEENA